MKRLLVLTLTASFAMAAHAERRFGSIDEYFKALGASQHQPHLADKPNENGRLVVGLLQIWPTPEEPKAVVFIAQESRTGELTEAARSKPFDFGDGGGRTYVEFVEAMSESRFSIQINYRGACSSGFDVFRFSRSKTKWVVAGRDSTRYSCSETDKSFGDTRNEISANFLNGKVVNRFYIQGKLQKMVTEKRVFPEFPIAGFDPFQDVYGPR